MHTEDNNINVIKLIYFSLKTIMINCKIKQLINK